MRPVPKAFSIGLLVYMALMVIIAWVLAVREPYAMYYVSDAFATVALGVGIYGYVRNNPWLYFAGILFILVLAPSPFGAWAMGIGAIAFLVWIVWYCRWYMSEHKGSLL